MNELELLLEQLLQTGWTETTHGRGTFGERQTRYLRKPVHGSMPEVNLTMERTVGDRYIVRVTTTFSTLTITGLVRQELTLLRRMEQSLLSEADRAIHPRNNRPHIGDSLYTLARMVRAQLAAQTAGEVQHVL
jgi:hypothetical protein